MCECSPNYNPDPALIEKLKFLFIVLIMNLILSIIFFFFLGFSTGLMGLVATLILFLAYRTYQHMYLAFYMILTIFSAFTFFLIIGIQIQQQILDPSEVTADTDYLIFISIISFSLIFYIFSIIISFQCYREMRAEFYEKVVMGRGDGDSENNPRQQPLWGANNQQAVSNNQQSAAPSSSNQRQGFVPFGGRGVSVG